MIDPDEILTYPESKLNISNCLMSIECAIAFDVRDWGEDNRSAWIYGIVHGWDEAMDEIAKKYHWNDTTVGRLNKLHKQWEAIKQMTEAEYGTN